MSSVTRRSFIKSSMALGAGLALTGPTSRVLGANDDIRLATVGVGGQGSLTASQLLGEATMRAGLNVMVGEVHGMAVNQLAGGVHVNDP